MARRTYLPTIIGLTEKLCQVILRATPIIQVLFPTNVALQTALSAANTACAVLAEEARKERAVGD